MGWACDSTPFWADGSVYGAQALSHSANVPIANPIVFVFDLSFVSQHWMGTLSVLLAVLLLLNVCRLSFVQRRRRTAKYARVVADCDLDDLTDAEAKPIN